MSRNFTIQICPVGIKGKVSRDFTAQICPVGHKGGVSRDFTTNWSPSPLISPVKIRFFQTGCDFTELFKVDA